MGNCGGTNIRKSGKNDARMGARRGDAGPKQGKREWVEMWKYGNSRGLRTHILLSTTLTLFSSRTINRVATSSLLAFAISLMTLVSNLGTLKLSSKNSFTSLACTSGGSNFSVSVASSRLECLLINWSAGWRRGSGGGKVDLAVDDASGWR